MRLRSVSYWGGLLAVTFWLAGCNVGPDYVRPMTAAGDDARFAWLPEQWGDSAQANDPNFANAWWETFGDPTTNELVQRALLHNTDLLAAAAAVDQAEAFLKVAYGARLPDASLGFNRTRQKMSFNLPTGRESFIAQGYSLDLSVS